MVVANNGTVQLELELSPVGYAAWIQPKTERGKTGNQIPAEVWKARSRVAKHRFKQSVLPESLDLIKPISLWGEQALLQLAFDEVVGNTFSGKDDVLRRITEAGVAHLLYQPISWSSLTKDLSILSVSYHEKLGRRSLLIVSGKELQRPIMLRDYDPVAVPNEAGYMIRCDIHRTSWISVAEIDLDSMLGFVSLPLVHGKFAPRELVNIYSLVESIFPLRKGIYTSLQNAIRNLKQPSFSGVRVVKWAKTPRDGGEIAIWANGAKDVRECTRCQDAMQVVDDEPDSTGTFEWTPTVVLPEQIRTRIFADPGWVIFPKHTSEENVHHILSRILVANAARPC